MRRLRVLAMDKAVKAGIDVAPFLYDWLKDYYFDIPLCVSDMKVGSAVELRYEEVLIAVTTHDGDYLICSYDLRECAGRYDECIACESVETLDDLIPAISKLYDSTADFLYL